MPNREPSSAKTRQAGRRLAVSGKTALDEIPGPGIDTGAGPGIDTGVGIDTGTAAAIILAKSDQT